ncbi:decaprenyl-phosphate phosphoribosyltransferase [Halomonas sp. H10-59]|uniref:Decaprenyl-phosphate phosphoribosyltransferase n=1 Tax=Halomonas sp. H10-59 TaxID=2950874 RepID=A0AAU7KYB2_9GAMM
MRSLIQLLRPHQYIKNGFVLVGALFSHQWDIITLFHALLAFFAFCCMASAVYILNDILDIEADRIHPVKCHRPLPSGAISRDAAKRVLLALVAMSLVISLFVSYWVVFFVVTYFVINIFYSYSLKHVVILDVFLISTGFMLRILAGTLGLDIAPSVWLLLCGLMVTLFLGFSKRRAELLMLESNENSSSRLARRVLDEYSPVMLEQFIAVTAACTVLSYGLYTVSPETIAMHGSDDLIYTLPFVVYGIFRYVYLLHHRSRGNDAAKDLLTDRHLLITVVFWVISTLWVLS